LSEHVSRLINLTPNGLINKDSHSGGFIPFSQK